MQLHPHRIGSFRRRVRRIRSTRNRPNTSSVCGGYSATSRNSSRATASASINAGSRRARQQREVARQLLAYLAQRSACDHRVAECVQVRGVQEFGCIQTEIGVAGQFDAAVRSWRTDASGTRDNGSFDGTCSIPAAWRMIFASRRRGLPAHARSLRRNRRSNVMLGGSTATTGKATGSTRSDKFCMGAILPSVSRGYAGTISVCAPVGKSIASSNRRVK